MHEFFRWPDMLFCLRMVTWSPEARKKTIFENSPSKSYDVSFTFAHHYGVLNYAKREKTPFCGFQLDIPDDVSFTFKLEKTCMMETSGVLVFPKNRIFLNFIYAASI